MKTADYLAAVKAKLNISSDYALAKALGISTKRMSKYSLGQDVPGTLIAFKIAEILGEQPVGVIAELELERAEKMAKTDDIEAWKARLRRWGGAAASILLGAVMLGQPNTGAASDRSSATDGSIHRRKQKKKKATPWQGLMTVAL